VSRALAAATTACVLVMLGCGAQAHPITAAGPSQPSVAGARVAVIVLENKAPDQLLRAGWLARMARKGARAANAYGETHPSLGNYLAMISGSVQGVHDDNVTHGPFSAPTLAGQLTRHRIRWRAYMNAMRSPCFGRTSDRDVTGRYAKRHNPFLFFTDVIGRPGSCARHVVPGTRLARDAMHRLPRFTWITPDLCQDMHDCSVAQGQRYLARTVPIVLRGLGSHGVLIITADEGAAGDLTRGGGRIPLVALGPLARRGYVLHRRVDHRTLIATIQDVLGVGRVPSTRGMPTARAMLR
jgi:hypothetical protein